MTVVNPGGGGGGTAAIAFGTAAGRPAAAAGNANTGYYATDTGELTLSNGAAWNRLQLTSGTFAAGGSQSIGFGVGAANGAEMGDASGLWVGRDGATGLVTVSTSLLLQGAAAFRTVAGAEAATATAGAAAALPATPQGYVIFTDHNGTARKVPYYAS